MSGREGTGMHRPPAVALGGRAAAPTVSRPIKLAVAGTPAKAKKSHTGSQPASAKKLSAVNTPRRASPAGKQSTNGSSATRATTPGRKGLGAFFTTKRTPAAVMRAGGSTAVSASLLTPPTQSLGVDGGGTTLASPPPALPQSQMYTPSVRRAPAGECVSPALSAVATTAQRSVAATSLAGGAAPSVAATSVAAATSAVTGERYEPTSYKVGYGLKGDYTCLEAVPQSAALWVGNKATGGLDVFSSTTGKLTVSLPPRSQIERAKLKNKARAEAGHRAAARMPVEELLFPSTSPQTAGDATPSPHVNPRESVGSTLLSMAPASPVVKPTALHASRTHMWVGYEDGNVAVYDHLVLTFITEGQFHQSTVVKFATLDNGTTVSASEDGQLVHWDGEAKNFEAITKLPRLQPSSLGHGHIGNQLSCLAALPRSHVVLCGFHSGALSAIDVRLAAQEQLHGRKAAASACTGASRGTSLVLHEGRINALAVLGDIFFSASEDGSVCATRLFFTVAGSRQALQQQSGQPLQQLPQQGVLNSAVLYSLTSPSTSAENGVSWRLLKRVHTAPCVRGLLTDKTTMSVYVAYADGLLERWSGNPNDDFGVEEVIREGMGPAASWFDKAAADGEAGTVVTTAGKHRTTGKKASPHRSTRSGATGTSALFGGGSGHREITGLVALNAVETLQVLALSSNGVNKVWYGHRNALEENISNSITALNTVIREDTRDAAVWRERLSLLKMKENERKAKYILILEQISEQRLLLKFYEKWRRRLLGNAAGRSKPTVAADFSQRCDYRLQARYFGKWASFYDAQQRQLRRHTLTAALAQATRRTYIVSLFHRWQMHMVQSRVRNTSVGYAAVLARAANARVAAPCFHRWLCFAKGRQERRTAKAAMLESADLDDSKLALLECKAQRQTLHRALTQWLDVAEQRRRQHFRHQTWEQYLDIFVRLNEARRAKLLFQGWRRWADRRRKHAALSAVAALRAQQGDFLLQHSFFLRWGRFVHHKHLEAHAAEIVEVEAKIKRVEAESGGDIFEKLQLQKHIDQLIQQQEEEERLLRLDQARLRELQDGRDGTLRQRDEDSQMRGQQRQSDGSVLVPVTIDTIAALPTSAATNGGSGTTTAGKGLMATHANYFRHLIDQQRLSPAVLSHMQLSEATYHAMSQLKGNVLNMYTDMGLFRQVKDKRRAGTTAVAILLENYAEVKRLIVSSVRRGTLKAASARAARWPLCLEALDSIPAHHCASVLNAIKTMVVAYDLISPEDAGTIAGTCEEIVANADWIFLIARACHLRRKPLLPVNNRI